MQKGTAFTCTSSRNRHTLSDNVYYSFSFYYWFGLFPLLRKLSGSKAFQLFVFLHYLQSLALSVCCSVMGKCGERPSWLHLVPNNLTRDPRLARSKLYTVELGWLQLYCFMSHVCVSGVSDSCFRSVCVYEVYKTQMDPRTVSSHHIMHHDHHSGKINLLTQEEECKLWRAGKATCFATLYKCACLLIGGALRCCPCWVCLGVFWIKSNYPQVPFRSGLFFFCENVFLQFEFREVSHRFILNSTKN